MIISVMEKTAKEERHERRRKEIVEAAKTCFAKRGFHSTSVAVIADTANINVGQLYRYFTNKEAIIAAIVEDAFSRMVQKIENDGIKKVFEATTEEDIIIHGEIYAEANHNAEVRKILKKAEQRMDEHMKGFLQKKFPDLSEPQLQLAADIVATICAGICSSKIRRRTFTKEYTESFISLLFSKDMINKYKKIVPDC